jgi:hypothetical protein
LGLDFRHHADHRQKLPPARAIGVLVRNLLISRRPLYALGEWAAPWEPALLGLGAQEIPLVNDDRIGRALDRAELLARATGRPAIATVAGETITEQAEQAARALKVWRVLDGRAFAPE